MPALPVETTSGSAAGAIARRMRQPARFVGRDAERERLRALLPAARRADPLAHDRSLKANMHRLRRLLAPTGIRLVHDGGAWSRAARSFIAARIASPAASGELPPPPDVNST